MLDILAQSLVDIFTTSTFFYLMLGIGIGLIVGILPALGASAGMALLVPFVYGMDQSAGVAMMVGLLAVVATGDTVTSVLMGIPGGGSSQATVLDGLPMARRGEAARALSAAYTASILGGLFGAVVLSAAILIARPVVLSFGVPELLMLTVLGITMVSLLSGKTLIKGFIACGLGMVFAAIGGSPATGELRMIIGEQYYLMDGLSITVVTLGVYAVPEIIDFLRRGSNISEVPPVRGGWLQGVIDTWRNRWLVLRCSVIGCLIGALPIGGSAWLAYGHAVQSSKDRESFGKGDVRGVIAPESANNADTGGALVPTMIFGIPGSGSTAVFLGGLILLGIQPGPDMAGSHLDITYTIIWSLAIANLVGGGLCFVMSGLIAKLTQIRFVYLAPYLLTIIFFGAFQSSRQWGDMVSLVAVGVFAVFLRRFGYPRPAFLIGFVLANNIEVLLYQVVQIYTWGEIFARPLFLVLLAVNLISLWAGLKFRPQIDTEGTTARVQRTQMLPQVLFVFAAIALAIYCIADVWDLSLIGSIYPIVAAGLTAFFSVVALWLFWRGPEDQALVFDSEVAWRANEAGYQTGVWHYLAWIAGYLAAMYVVGFILGTIIFFVAFLRTQSPARWWQILLTTGVTITILVSLSHVLVADLPSGLLQQYLPLPWPFK